MTPKERAKEIVTAVEALAWADNWTVHKSIPLVIKHIEEAIAAEREACAKLCELYLSDGISLEDTDYNSGIERCIEAIRARGGNVAE